MPEQNLTPEILAAALQGLEAQRTRLDAHIAQVRRLLGARTAEPAAAAKAPKPKRKMSAAGRKRIVAATKKRWAEFHRQQAEAAKATKPTAVKKAALEKPAKKTTAKGKKRAAVKVATQPVAAEGASE